MRLSRCCSIATPCLPFHGGCWWELQIQNIWRCPDSAGVAPFWPFPAGCARAEGQISPFLCKRDSGRLGLWGAQQQEVYLTVWKLEGHPQNTPSKGGGSECVRNLQYKDIFSEMSQSVRAASPSELGQSYRSAWKSLARHQFWRWRRSS